ncbi:hypothetical protein [Gordonia alkaliphila]|uniref:hypothetical protein n=1 Tax=Gordonia alkaliphila TaxID=1053547 RepID=UPI0031EE7752
MSREVSMHRPVTVDEVNEAIAGLLRGGPVPPGRAPQPVLPTPSEVLARLRPEEDLAASRGRSADFAEARVRLASGEATVGEDGLKWLVLDLSELREAFTDERVAGIAAAYERGWSQGWADFAEGC